MAKFNPHYKLKLRYLQGDKIVEAVITDPISIRFNVSKNTFQSSNTTRITVYNMDAEHREGMYHDRLLFNIEKTKTVTLYAGYGDAKTNLTLISFGYVQQCYSTRQGTDIITEIDVQDPDILTQYTSKTFKAGTQKKEAYLNILREGLPDLIEGVGTESINGKFEINTTFDGLSFDMINMITGNHTFIDDNTLHTLYDHQTISNYGVYYIASETGLLGTPVRQDNILQIKMLFEPTIKIGQLVEIKTETANNKYFNGQYKVVGLSHDCSISQSEGGSRTTTLNLLYLENLQNSNVAYTNNPSGSLPTKWENGKEIPIYATISGEDRNIYKYIQDNNGAIPNIKINYKISWKDMLQPIGSGNRNADIKREITLQVIANCRAIANQLADFCTVYFPGKKIIIGSGWRTTKNNIASGGSSTSNHLKGSAIDLKISGVSTNTLINTFVNHWKLGLGTYSWGVHVSLNPQERFRR